MKISEMIKNLEEFKEKHGDIECWYAEDDEGNGHRRIYYKPSLRYIGLDYEMYNDEEDVEYCGIPMSEVEPICIVN